MISNTGDKKFQHTTNTQNEPKGLFECDPLRGTINQEHHVGLFVLTCSELF
jgi:hypothetical protein